MSIHNGFGTAYWGRDWNRAKSDLLELKINGFSWIVFPASEERMMYDREGLKDIMDYAKDLDLEVWLSPWGVGGYFGGEGVSSGPGAISRWVELASLTNDRIYWDEPKGVHGPTIPSIYRSAFKHHALYFNPDLAIYPPRHYFEGIRAIGVDCYNREPEEAKTMVFDLASSHGTSGHVWVQGFRILRNEEWRVRSRIQELYELGVQSIGIWGGGKSGEGVSCLNNDHEGRLFNEVQKAIKWCKEYSNG